MANAQISNGDWTPSSDPLKPTNLTNSASFRSRKKTAAAISRAGSDVEGIITFLHGSDPVKVELNRLENEVRGSDSHILASSIFLV